MWRQDDRHSDFHARLALGLSRAARARRQARYLMRSILPPRIAMSPSIAAAYQLATTPLVAKRRYAVSRSPCGEEQQPAGSVSQCIGAAKPKGGATAAKLWRFKCQVASIHQQKC